MNIVKIQTDFLKFLLTGKKTLFCSGVDGKVGLSDSIAVYLIPEKMMYLDRKEKDFFDLKKNRLLDAFERSVSVEQAGTVKTDSGDAVRFKNENTFVFVQKKYLAYFDKYDKFYAKGPRDPLYVTDSNLQILAIICPYRIKDEELKCIYGN